ncbi:MAG TPA: LysR family transcriptional regulator [Solirubrobacteraceae bacterium]|nr:LysR family transcriptional regulator [Solirubrobacteraceae bacterium]
MAPDGVDLHPRVLQQFLVLAETRDLETAAGRLGVTPAALKRSMNTLGRRLGTRLFMHDARALELTADGAALVGPAATAVSAAARFTARMRSIEGVLRVAHASGVDTLSVVLDRYCTLHPEVEVQEQVLPCEAQLAALRDREIDVAVCRLIGSAPIDCEVELLRLDPLLAAVAADATAPSLSVDPARTSTHVGETGGEWLARDDLIASFERAAGCRLHRVRVLIGAGQHVAALERTHAPAFLMMSSSNTPPVRRRLVGLVPRQPYFPWSLVWPKGSSAAVTAFIETARTVSSENDWLAVDRLPGNPWLPEDDFHRPRLGAEPVPELPSRVNVSEIRQASNASGRTRADATVTT